MAVTDNDWPSQITYHPNIYVLIYHAFWYTAINVVDSPLTSSLGVQGPGRALRDIVGESGDPGRLLRPR